MLHPSFRGTPAALRVAFGLALAAGSSAASALDVTLDFSGNICGAAGNIACGNSAFIGQNYGDQAGLLDVSHRSLNATTLVTQENALKYWSTGYSGLVGVAWGGPGPTVYASEFTFTPAAGQMVTINSFDFGDDQNRNFGSSVAIYDAAGSVLWDGGTFNPGLTPTSFSPMITSSSALVLRWGPDGYDVGIDNIALTVTAVPEPGTWALMLLGAVAVAGLARRRERG
jgi:PEP-CTERM motif